MTLYRSSEKFDSTEFFSYQQKGLRSVLPSLLVSIKIHAISALYS